MIYQKNPKLSDQMIYMEARKYTIATMQHIVFNEWLPSFLGETLPEYHGYDPMIDPQINDLFEILSNAYLYTLISPSVFKLSTECSKNFRYSILRTCNTYFDPINYLVRDGFEKILIGLLLQSSQRDDHFIVEDILHYAKGIGADFTRQNLVAILLQYSRDFQQPDYLTVRKTIGLDSNITYGSFRQLLRSQWSYSMRINHRLEIILSKLYQNIQNIDLIVGALLENNGKQPGSMIKYFFLEQFLRLRNGDRFYFENQFDSYQIKMIKSIKFSDIIKSITQVNDELIQSDAFKLPNEDQNRISEKCFESLRKLLRIYPCEISDKTTKCLTLSTFQTFVSMENCTKGQCYDYFNGSELSFVVTILLIPLFIIILVIILKLLVYMRHHKSECQRIKVSKLRRMTINNDDNTMVQEWLGNNDGYRNTIISLNSKSRSIIVRLPYESRIVRCIYLKNNSIGKISIELSLNNSQNYMLIRFPKEYDLVLKFDSYYDREKFLTKLEGFLNEIHYQMERTNKELRFIFKSAYTRNKRQKHLEKFFRVIFSQAFNQKMDKKQLDMKTAKEIIETELTEFEFAEVLSMRPDATFVRQMFRLIDSDNNGYISFREFLDVIIIFAKGSAEQKIRIMFDMYDVNQTGRLSMDDFSSMIKSLLEIANQSVSPKEMQQTIQSMLIENGFNSKKELTFDDFSRLFHNYKDELGYTELNFDLSSLDKLPTSSTQTSTTTTTKRKSKINRANDTIVRSYFGGNQKNNIVPDFTKQAPTFLKIETQEPKLSSEPEWLITWIRFLDARKKEIFFLIFFNLIVLIIFLDKAYYYIELNESSGLRQIAGFGIPLTRGSASVIMFVYSAILLTMCRNIITVIRETFLHHYIPFDSVVSFHKYLAFIGFIMAIIHSFGHLSNFYHISTQRPQDLNCILSETYFSYVFFESFFTLKSLFLFSSDSQIK